MKTGSSGFSSMVGIVLIGLPWLNPFAPGPTPAVNQFLFSWTLLALLVQLSILSGRGLNPVSIASGGLAAKSRAHR